MWQRCYAISPLIISTWRTSPPRGVRVTGAMGCISPTGACTLCPWSPVVLLAGGRAQWRCVLLLQNDERLRHWCTPRRRRPYNPAEATSLRGQRTAGRVEAWEAHCISAYGGTAGVPLGCRRQPEPHVGGYHPVF